jgi:hypothetical protein
MFTRNFTIPWFSSKRCIINCFRSILVTRISISFFALFLAHFLKFPVNFNL